MMIRVVPRCSSLAVLLSLSLAACDDTGGGKADSEADAGMDAGDDEESDASATEDVHSMRDSAPARDSASGGDSASAVDAGEDPYRCEPPSAPDSGIGMGQPCCEGIGTCVSAGDAGTSSVGDCNAAQNLVCMAASSAGADAGATALAKCRMRPGNADAGTSYEGRCVPECLTRGSSSLAQGECAADFVCTPCYNLITGESTGVCDNNGDGPVDPAPPGFAECGESLGYCIPVTSIGPTGANLQQMSCEADERCAPKQRVEEPDSCFARCDSVFGAGACLPAFLIPMESRGILQPATCATGELCSPCINPTTMMRTGACN
jgi:hypothetical protein